MTDASTSAAPSTPWRPEWWERARDRVRGWARAHPLLVRRARLAWWAASLAGLVVLVVAVVVWPNVAAAVGVAWLLVCWWALARTRTLTFGAVTLLYAVCVPWSIVIGLVSLGLADAVPAGWALRGPGALGPSVGIAAVTEESFKLLPIALLALLAPGRVRRFAAVDWLLVGFAAGAAFLTVEEVQRRLSVLAPGARGGVLSSLICGGGGIDRRLDCHGITRFGINPFGAGPAQGGLLGGAGDGPLYAGHHVLTALVTAGMGLGFVVWRWARRRSSTVARVGWCIAAVALPVVLFWVAVADHVVLNVSASAAGTGGSGAAWLQPASTVPAVFQAWWVVGGHGHGRTGLLVALLLAGLLCDAARARRHGYWAIGGPPGQVWADRATGWWERRVAATETSGAVRHLRDGVATAVAAAISLGYVVTRDLRLTAATHARQPGEPRVEAMLRGRAALVMQREAREIATDLDACAHAGTDDAGAAHRRRYRAMAGVLVVALLVVGLVVGPHLATSIGWDPAFASRWLAGLFDALARWWGGLTPGAQLVLGIAAGAVLAAPFGLGAGLFLAGGLTYLAEHGHGAASWVRDPKAATRGYLERRSLGGMALDAGEFGLTFIPAGLGAGVSALHVGTRGVVRDYLHDPAAWRMARRAGWRESRLHPERGAITYGWPDGFPRVNGQRPRGYRHAGTTWRGEPTTFGKGWSKDLKDAYPGGITYNKLGFPDFSPHATQTAYLPKGFTGSRSSDDKVANAIVKLSSKPAGFTWHHVEDGHTMLLVPENLHNAVPHTGGHAIVKP